MTVGGLMPPMHGVPISGDREDLPSGDIRVIQERDGSGTFT